MFHMFRMQILQNAAENSAALFGWNGLKPERRLDVWVFQILYNYIRILRYILMAKFHHPAFQGNCSFETPLKVTKKQPVTHDL